MATAAYTGLSGTVFAAHHTVLSLASAAGEVNELVLGPTVESTWA